MPFKGRSLQKVAFKILMNEQIFLLFHLSDKSGAFSGELLILSTQNYARAHTRAMLKCVTMEL